MKLTLKVLKDKYKQEELGTEWAQFWRKETLQVYLEDIQKNQGKYTAEVIKIAIEEFERIQKEDEEEYKKDVVAIMEKKEKDDNIRRKIISKLTDKEEIDFMKNIIPIMKD